MVSVEAASAVKTVRNNCRSYDC